MYRDMDISSAKITETEMAGIPHYGLDLIRPDEEFSVADFQKYAFKKNRGNPSARKSGDLVWRNNVVVRRH